MVVCAVAVVWAIGHFFVQRLDVKTGKKFELTIANLAALSVFLVTYNIYVSVVSNDRIEKNRIAYNTLENIERNWLQPQKELLENYPEGYFLYASMTPDADFGSQAPEIFDSVKRRQLEVYGSIRVFQVMEDFLTFGAWDITGSYVWLNNFLMWMQSPILRLHWKELSFNFSDDSRRFIERIIAQSEELVRRRESSGPLTTQDYDAISKKFEVNLR